MRLVTFTHGPPGEARTRTGVVREDGIVDLSVAAPGLPRELAAFLSAGDAALAAARSAAEKHPDTLALDQVKLESPVMKPSKFLAIGLNYRDHIEETGREAPEFPVFFNKQVSCITGPYDPIHVPRASRAVDYEGELAFVIGRRCRHVPKERASEVIAGYLVANDVTVRDWQRRAPTMTLGKSWDTHGPLGPWLVTSDEIEDPHALDIRTFVNDEVRQDSNTRHLIFDCFEQVEVLSTVCTLEPGDVISTGTTSGVGYVRDPRAYLVAGDVVRVEIERIGKIENRVIDEPENTATFG
jgi:2-keto-4-pentenoate hydratase/2-oxohepta-3-ene-1,7-dioic acid hydratase in catechol pathway